MIVIKRRIGGIMNKQLNKIFKTIAIIIMVTILSLFMTLTFAACDDSDTTNLNDKTNSGESGYHSALLEKMLGYGIETCTCSNITSYYATDLPYGDGFCGYNYLFSQTPTSIICYIFEYENSNFATSNLETIKNSDALIEGFEWNVFADDNTIIAESITGLYEKIKSFSGSIPSGIITDKQKEFMSTAFNATPPYKDLKERLASIYLYNNCKITDDEYLSGMHFGYDIYPLTGYSESYECGPVANFSDYEIDENSLEGSFDKTEDGIRYIYIKNFNKR